jgi:hypothetical protein
MRVVVGWAEDKAMRKAVGYVFLLLGAAAVVGALYAGLTNDDNPGSLFLLAVTAFLLGGACLRAAKATPHD